MLSFWNNFELQKRVKKNYFLEIVAKFHLLSRLECKTGRRELSLKIVQAPEKLRCTEHFYHRRAEYDEC